jgi:tRNA nucleotidyltransferase/poly(A) polymerase
MRRDLTINALYADFSGRIYDYFNGIDDLNQGIIRFVGDAATRITEDYLRLLRLFRFHAWYSKHPIDNATLKICERLAPKLLTLSKERITKEFLKLLEAPFPLPSLRQMADYSVLTPLFQSYNLPHLTEMISLEQQFKIAPSPFRRLAVFTKDYHTFRFSNVQEGYLEKISTFLAEPLFEEVQYRFHLALEKKEVIRDAILIKYIEESLQNPMLLHKIMNDLETLKIPPFPITGIDLLKLGMSGPQLGEMLARCRWWWTENKFHPNKEACVLWVNQQLKHPS